MLFIYGSNLIEQSIAFQKMYSYVQFVLKIYFFSLILMLI